MVKASDMFTIPGENLDRMRAALRKLSAAMRAVEDEGQSQHFGLWPEQAWLLSVSPIEDPGSILPILTFVREVWESASIDVNDAALETFKAAQDLVAGYRATFPVAPLSVELLEGTSEPAGPTEEVVPLSESELRRMFGPSVRDLAGHVAKLLDIIGARNETAGMTIGDFEEEDRSVIIEAQAALLELGWRPGKFTKPAGDGS